MSRQYPGSLPLMIQRTLPDGWAIESLMKQHGFVAELDVRPERSRLPGIFRSISIGDSLSQVISMISLLTIEHTREARKLLGVAVPAEKQKTLEERRLSAFRAQWPSANVQLSVWQAANPNFSTARASFRMNIHNTVEASQPLATD